MKQALRRGKQALVEQDLVRFDKENNPIVQNTHSPKSYLNSMSIISTGFVLQTLLQHTITLVLDFACHFMRICGEAGSNVQSQSEPTISPTTHNFLLI